MSLSGSRLLVLCSNTGSASRVGGVADRRDVGVTHRQWQEEFWARWAGLREPRRRAGRARWAVWVISPIVPYFNGSTLIWLAVANSSELVRQLRRMRGFYLAYHRGPSLDRSCSCCTLLTCYCLLRAMVSSLICMQMTPKSVVHLQRLSFRISYLPASMM